MARVAVYWDEDRQSVRIRSYGKSLADDYISQMPDSSLDELLEILMLRSKPEATYRLLDDETEVVTQDWYFRDAWKDELFNVDMVQARAIHLVEIRRVRDAELVKEDINMLRAIEGGDASVQSTVATRKQALRDIPATFDITTGVTTPEALKAQWPAELPARE